VGEGDWHHWTFWLGGGELLTGALVVGGFLMAVRAIRRATPQQAIHHDTHAGHGPDWLDIFLAVMLTVEVLVHYEETGRWRRPTILVAATTLGFGIFHGKLRARMLNRRSLKVADGGLIVPGRFSAGLTASWPQLDRIEIGPDAAAIVTSRGRTHRLAFARVLHADALRAALEGAQAKLAEYKKTTVHAATDPSALRDSSGGQQAKTD
jgi:hypothetical protein